VAHPHLLSDGINYRPRLQHLPPLPHREPLPCCPQAPCLREDWRPCGDYTMTNIPVSRYHRHVTMLPADAQTARAGLAPAAALFRSLADPARLAIVQRLAGGQARVVDLTAELGLAQSTVSKHLACLRECGLAEVRPVGRASVYSLAQPALIDLLSAAETVLAATGNAVALCPTYGRGR
jgi:DNA-binding transcriptional ArsR family regulator